ncbi:hypothetical protein [Nocardia sp. NPDC004123]
MAVAIPVAAGYSILFRLLCALMVDRRDVDPTLWCAVMMASCASFAPLAPGQRWRASCSVWRWS